LFDLCGDTFHYSIVGLETSLTDSTTPLTLAQPTNHQNHAPKMAHATPTTTPSPKLRIQTRPRRLSKFTEGSELIRLELLQRTPISNSHFFTILSEMDAHEARRRSPTSPETHQHHCTSNSNSSVESFSSGSWPDKEGEREFEKVVKEGKRCISFGRKSLDERPSEMGEMIRGFKRRLRALTAGRGGDVKPFSGP